MPNETELLPGHTPGPWHIRHCDDNGCMCMTAISAVPVPPGNVDCYEDRDPEDMIAIVYHQSVPFVRPENSRDTAWGDACLIAAAPDLLAACELAVEEFERLNGAGTCPLEIEDAIAKARGGK